MAGNYYGRKYVTYYILKFRIRIGGKASILSLLQKFPSNNKYFFF